MKKICVLVALATVCLVSYAQPRALGLRLGYGAELTYQHSLGTANMVELEVGLPGFEALEVACTYDWLNPGGSKIAWNKRGEWNWYAGVGAAISAPTHFDHFFAGAAGRIGIEYCFWFPLQLSIDWRPTLGVMFGGNETKFAWDAYAGGLGLSVRYKF